VNGVSLEIRPGELFFLLGPSGCGKTTLLRMVAGFIDPTSGTIAFDGRDVTRTPPNKRNTGMVFQSYALWPHMTVAQNVAFGLEVRRVAGEERARRVGEALAAVHMDGFAQRKPNQLSGGQQQRVALARALVVRPDVLLLDEPLSNLDARLRIELRSEIRRICKESGITTVYVTHDQKEALSMADRVAILDRGRVIQLGPPAELYQRPATRFVAEFLGETNVLPGTASTGTPPTRVDTAAGVLLAAQRPPTTAVLVSIRPEALRLRRAPGVASEESVIRGRLAEATYLGETTQYRIEAPGGLALRALALKHSAVPPVGASVYFTVAPEDVVLLPAG
jgi:iron(III) transport system ATP-binding protein